MAYTFSTNNAPATFGIGMYTLISTLMTAGWTKVMDSDGTTYSASGTQVTSGGVGANGLNNASAWVRMRSPATNGGSVVNQTRELVIQRGSTHLIWKLKYSASALFKGGNPGATVTPSNQTADLYLESNKDGVTSMQSGGTVGTGQSFTGDGYALYSARFYLARTTSPTGFAIAKIYAHSGSFGSTSIPTGAALATSIPVDISALPTSFAAGNANIVEFMFQGANAITLTAATNYFVSIEYSGSGGTVDVGKDGSSPTHSGNSATWNGVTWTAVNTSDVCFFILTGAQDEVNMLGGGGDTATSATFTTWFADPQDSVTPQRWNVIAGGAAEFYSFYAFSFRSGTLFCNTGIFLDVLAPGSYSPLDVDPAVIYCSTNAASFGSEVVSSSFPSSQSTNPALCRAWLGPTTNAGSSLVSNNVNVKMTTYTAIGSIGANATFGVNPWSRNDDLLPGYYGNVQVFVPRGLKGVSTLFMLGTVGHQNYALTDSVSLGSRDKIYLTGGSNSSTGLWAPWNGSPIII